MKVARIINPLLARKLLRKMMSRHSYGDSQIVMNAAGAWGEKEIIYKWVFGKPTLYEFEGMAVFGPEHMHEYLTSLYGDYMILPPVEKRKGHNFLYVNLELPYRDFNLTMLEGRGESV